MQMQCIRRACTAVSAMPPGPDRHYRFSGSLQPCQQTLYTLGGQKSIHGATRHHAAWLVQTCGGFKPPCSPTGLLWTEYVIRHSCGAVTCINIEARHLKDVNQPIPPTSLEQQHLFAASCSVTTNAPSLMLQVWQLTAPASSYTTPHVAHCFCGTGSPAVWRLSAAIYQVCLC